MSIFLIYPNQLFKNIDNLKNKKVLLIEDTLFFTQYSFHIQKLILHRASMKFYEQYLKNLGIEVEYFENESYLDIYNNEEIFIYELFDNYLEKKVYKNFKNINIIKNPNFIHPNDNNKFMHNFYKNRRKELNIFMENGKPLYEKYSFDNENRKKLPKDIIVPTNLSFENRFINEAKKYCKRFNSVGECKSFNYPITFEEAEIQLNYFLKNSFNFYGDYQDAITKKEGIDYLFHSNISSSLNIGLIDLNILINKIVSSNAPFNAKEGFIRQIIGWREFMLSVYENNGIKMRNSNFFSFKNPMPQKIIEGKSGIEILDNTVKKVNKTSYAHHIERLMILGNIFLLLEIDPNEVYKYFMQYFIDAYDWVMVGNVYGMSQFSDGGTITTKPYISSSNYLIKMSDYSKNESWCRIIDALYWRFLYKYSHLFSNNPRMKMQISLLNKISKERLEEHLNIANEYLNKIHNKLQ